MKTLTGIRALIVTAGVMLLAGRAEAKLTVGDPAPKLQPGKWIQGEPVRQFDTNHVYIVEFWATWCGPCRASIPHLNELYEKFKDRNLVAIGQDVWEHNDAGVADFVKKMGDQMTYRVALDDKSQDDQGIMATTWMSAAGQHGIPTAFVINKHGIIAWIGHPMTLTETVLNQILNDTFDTAAFTKEYEKQQQKMKRRTDLSGKLRTAMASGDWDAAEEAVNDLEKTVPANARYQFSSARLEILLGRKDYAGAYKLADSLGDSHKSNAYLQNELAWTLCTTPGVDQSGLTLANKLAKQANAAANDSAPQILDTLARTQFMIGQTNEAVATEQKAIAIAPDELKPALKKFLAAYQQGKLP